MKLSVNFVLSEEDDKNLAQTRPCLCNTWLGNRSLFDRLPKIGTWYCCVLWLAWRVVCYLGKHVLSMVFLYICVFIEMPIWRAILGVKA